MTSKVTSFDIATTPSPYKYPNFTELASAIGLVTETHEVTSEDGYVLTLFNIPGNKSRPILIMHGIMDNADTFILRGNGSLGYTLAKEGYDVWFGNFRGNRYNRRHATLDPIEAEFWNFTYHEIGYYDLPAIIDYILNKTEQTQLSAIGFSLGTTIFYVLGSTRPEYNTKIKILICLAPIAYFKHVEPPVSTLIGMAPYISFITQDMPELKVDKSNFLATCQSPASVEACRQFLFSFAGADDEEIELDFFRTFHDTSASVSRKLAIHMAKSRKVFAQYDFGSQRNLQVYNSAVPPQYNLSACVMKMALFVGKNDKLSVIKDVELLRDQLPNVVEYRVVDRDLCNHFDFVWGRNMHVYLLPYVLDTLEKYS
ncbi:hypothetical protein O3G_MSEX009703 [Manduca sexta]|uniref:Lipase n=1 Tax=Manduca sexta TaxID=7130 RepID=A0A921ZEZ2_MANSE|nr:hypothetical protein O3G_MSEX009703 [Manduca sexta]